MSAIKHRRTYPELSRLSKARGLRSIRFKRTTPGVVARLLLAPSATPLVNSWHPLAAVSPRQLRRMVPQYECSLFQAHAYPHAVLSRFENPSFFRQMKGQGISNELDNVLDSQTANLREKLNPTGTRAIQSSGDRRRAMHTIPMSLILVTPKKSVHKFAIVRTKVKLRLREALRLVAIRGARLKPSESKLVESDEIVLDSPDGITKDAIQRTPILQGWTYIIRPNLEIYRCPWPSLLDHVAKALIRMQSQGDALERKWGVGKHTQRSVDVQRGFDGETQRHLPESILQLRTTPRTPDLQARQQQQDHPHKSAAFRSMPSYARHSAHKPEQIPRTRSQNAERGSDNVAKPSTFIPDNVPKSNPKSSNIQAAHQRQSFPRESAGVFRSADSYMRRPAGESEHYPNRPLQDTGNRTYRPTKSTHEERPRSDASSRSTPPHSWGSACLDQPPVGPQRHTENDSSAKATRPSRDSAHDSPVRRPSWNSPREPPKSPPEVPATDGRSAKPGRLFQSPIVIVKPQGSQRGRRGPSSQGDGRSGGPSR